MDFSSVQALVADDDEVVRDTLSESLSSMGFLNVRQAGDGQEALEILSAMNVDLLLLDLAMPRVRGEEVVEVALNAKPDLVIIVITGFATLEKAIDLMKKGIFDLLRKPFSYQTLCKKIESAILKWRSRKERPDDQSRDFCDYTLVEEIARGGAGVVWKALEKKSGQTVAIKVLLAGAQATDEQILRFHREASTVSELRHPNIVSMMKIGACRGKHFIAMDYIAGTALDIWVEERSPDVRSVASMIAKVGRAVHYAHMRDILHRDLKPSNVLVDEQGQPHIIDFGLARSVRERARITRRARLHGTMGYIAPERFNERIADNDVRSDVFSLGVILYELLSGIKPYRFSSDDQVFPDFTAPPRPCHEIRPSVPVDLTRIALKAVQVNPENRYSGALEFVTDLETAIQGLPVRSW